MPKAATAPKPVPRTAAHPVQRSAPPPVAIKRGESYPLQAFLKITGWSKEALRNRRDEGLRVVYLGREAWISGDDFNDFISGADRRTER